MSEPSVTDLNAVVITAEVAKAIDYAQPFSHVELKILSPARGPVFIAAFVPLRLLRELYPLAVGDRVLIRGELGFSRSDKLPQGGQHIIVASTVERLDAAGRTCPDAPALEPNPYGQVIARPLPRGDRQRRHLKRRGRPEGQRP